MKILFLHISDLHCKKETRISDNVKLEKIVQSVLKYKGQIDEIVIICSGDVTWSGKQDEFIVAKKVFGFLLSQINQRMELGKYIHFFVVPGNHDINITELNRDSTTISKYYKKNTVEKFFFEELKYMNNFFKYSISKKCFTQNKVCESQLFSLTSDQNYFFQVNLINTAPFSTLRADNKELHYIPDSDLSPLYRDERCNVCITIMHHSTEWFHWDKKEILENIIYRNYDIIFQGHEHLPHNVVITDEEKNEIRIFKGGELSIDNSMASQYGIVIFDTENHQIEEYLYTWDYAIPIFREREISKKTPLNIKSSIFNNNKDFINEFYRDKLGLCDNFLEYYVFPNVYYKYPDEENIKSVISEDLFFTELSDKKIIEVHADRNSGKTTFLKYIYSVSQKHDFVPLYIGADEYPVFKINKIIKRVFCDQYDEYEYEKYNQIPKEQKVLFIDDVDQFKNPKFINIVLSQLSDEIGHIVYTTGSKFDLDIVEEAKEKINKDKILQIKMASFYKEKRHQLVTNVCKVTSNMNDSDINNVVLFIDNMVHRQTGLFSLSPEFIITYLKYFLANNYQKSKQDDVFNKVFETNINNAIIASTSKNNVDIYINMLSEIAYNMHFSKKEQIQDQELNEIIGAFNEKYKKKIIPSDFIQAMIQSRLLEYTKESIAIKFSSYNFMAYFVAIKLSRNLERNPSNLDDLNYIVRNICFGINDTILLFLSYIRSNVSLVYIFIKEVNCILSGVEKLDFDKNNIPLLKAYNKSEIKMPSTKEKQQIDYIDEQQEIAQYTDTVKYTSLYDYKEDDANKIKNKFIRAKKCIEIISKSLVSLYSVLEASEIDTLVKCIYEFPNKLLYSFLKPYDENAEVIIQDLKDFISELSQEYSFTDEDLWEILASSCTAIVLSTYDNIAYYGSDTNTISYLSEFSEYNSNIIVQKLLMYEATCSSEEFVKRAINIYERTDDIFIQRLVKLVVRKHLITHDLIDHKELDRIASKIFVGSKKELLLISSKTNH